MRQPAFLCSLPPPHGVTWGRLRLGLAALSGLALTASPVRTSPPGSVLSVVVRAVPGTAALVQRSVVEVGGTIEASLGIIDGFVVRLESSAIPDLRASRNVVSVTPDSALQLLSGSYSAQTDPYSLYNTEVAVGNRNAWTSQWTGSGIDVALIDSGIAPVSALANPGQVIHGPDLTEESQNPDLANLDTFGHGTFMASIIAGHDPGATVAAGNSGAFMGVAPDARLVSVKVADARGLTDVSQVIAGIDWVVQHAHDPGLNIRVINLSFGTDSAQSYKVDPLAYAAEVAWRSGIVVVTSAGNDGTTAGRLTMPAADPTLIAVGAVDLNGQATAAGATVPAFSSRGDGVRDPDLLAPGVHVQGLRVPGSYVDWKYGPTAAIDDRFFRGSGTSEAAAFVSGSIAQLLQQRPWMTPDRVKALLLATANRMPSPVDARAQGAGILDMFAAVGARTVPLGVLNGGVATGLGTLEGSRGTAHMVLDGVQLRGERDIFGHAFNSLGMATAESLGRAWSGGKWNGNVWSGSGWSGGDWTGHTWSSCDWTGGAWSDDDWSSGTWDGTGWQNTSWSGAGWTGFTWSGSDWSGFTWSTAGGTSGVWANDSWS